LQQKHPEVRAFASCLDTEDAAGTGVANTDAAAIEFSRGREVGDEGGEQA
jgi:hypothetical protein